MGNQGDRRDVSDIYLNYLVGQILIGGSGKRGTSRLPPSLPFQKPKTKGGASENRPVGRSVLRPPPALKLKRSLSYGVPWRPSPRPRANRDWLDPHEASSSGRRIRARSSSPRGGAESPGSSCAFLR